MVQQEGQHVAREAHARVAGLTEGYREVVEIYIGRNESAEHERRHAR